MVAYFAQLRFPEEQICHRLIHTLPGEEVKTILREILQATQKIWTFNREHHPELEIAIDSNGYENDQ